MITLCYRPVLRSSGVSLHSVAPDAQPAPPGGRTEALHPQLIHTHTHTVSQTRPKHWRTRGSLISSFHSFFYGSFYRNNDDKEPTARYFCLFYWLVVQLEAFLPRILSFVRAVLFHRAVSNSWLLCDFTITVGALFTKSFYDLKTLFKIRLLFWKAYFLWASVRSWSISNQNTCKYDSFLRSTSCF